MFRAVVVALGLAVSVSTASAQITTYIAPPRPAKPTPQMVASADSARADSAAAVAMTNMKSWVDSAAGVTVPSRVGDTAVRADSVPPVGVTTFEDGAVAPNTASALPTIGLIGLVAFVLGAVLLAGRPRTRIPPS
jgi:hypothetical protein